MYTQTQQTLLKEVMAISGVATEEDAVTVALMEYVKPKNPKIRVIKRAEGDLK